MKKIAIVGISIASVIGLAACGGGSTQSQTTTTQETPSQMSGPSRTSSANVLLSTALTDANMSMVSLQNNAVLSADDLSKQIVKSDGGIKTTTQSTNEPNTVMVTNVLGSGAYALGVFDSKTNTCRYGLVGSTSSKIYAVGQSGAPCSSAAVASLNWGQYLTK